MEELDSQVHTLGHCVALPPAHSPPTPTPEPRVFYQCRGPHPFPPLHPCAAGSRCPRVSPQCLTSLCSSPALWPLLWGHPCHLQPGQCAASLLQLPPPGLWLSPSINSHKMQALPLFVQQAFTEHSVRARHCSGHWRCSRKHSHLGL